MSHQTDIRVYYEDTDSGGVVYYANYLKFAERARTELLRSAGFENKSLQSGKGIIFVVRHIEADYLKPARLDNLLKVETEVLEIKSASFVVKQTIICQDVIVFSSHITLACVDAAKFIPAKLPDDIKDSLGRYRNKG